MAEKLTDILNRIKFHVAEENKQHVRNRSIGRAFAKFDNGEQQVWILPRPYKPVHQQYVMRNLMVHSVKTSNYPDTLTSDGAAVAKNMQIGRILQQYCTGTFTYKTPQGVRKVEIINSSSYVNRGDNPSNLRVGISGQGWMPEFTSLLDAMKKYASTMDSLREKEEARKKAEAEKKRLEEEQKQREQEKMIALQKAKEEVERKRIEEQHKREEEERQRLIHEEEERLARIALERDELEEQLADEAEKYANAASFIRKQASLRLNPVLDRIQDNIKFSHIYDGIPLIINGGPGTGKTTTLIQRLKLLISPEELADYALNNDAQELSVEQNELISKEGGNWIFFSPTELLKQYLKENMNYEGLQNTNQKVQVWENFLRGILRDKYQLVGDNKPFSFRKREFENTVLIQDKQLELIQQFREFYLNELKNQLLEVSKLDFSYYDWKYIGDPVKKICEEAQKATSIREVILVLIRLSRFKNNFGQPENKPNGRELGEKFNTAIRQEAITYLSQWKKDEKYYQSLLSWLDEEEDAIDDVEPNEDEEESNTETQSSELNLASKLRDLLRKIVYEFTENKPIIGKSAELKELIGNRINTERLNSLSNLAIYNKKVYPLIRNYEDYLFSNLPKAYKKFRTAELQRGDNEQWNLPLLKLVVGKFNNKPLHVQEQSLMLGFVNEIILSIKAVSNDRFKNLSHKYATAYFDVIRPIIGIDEATDYCLLDYYAIKSLLHYEISSLTLTGDNMQCLKGNGIFDWKQLKDRNLFAKIEVSDLKVSYRQSKELLKMAHSLYLKTMHKRAPYTCYLENVNNVPKPLWYENDDEGRKAKWIVDRVLEIKNNYGFVPSIAVFVTDPNDAKLLKDEIDEIGKLESAGIDVADCSGGDKLSNSDTVRIFPISQVKGMEFEVVFFHNIHKLENLVERFLYVGLSRATFYMGVTSDMLEDGVLEQVQRLFNKKGNWKKLVEDKTATTHADPQTLVAEDVARTSFLQPLSVSEETRTGQRWTLEENELVSNLFNQGYKPIEIGKHVGRSELAILSKLGSLGLIDFDFNRDK